MSKIKVYSDESYCNKKSFRIITVVWGNPNYCDLLENEISNIVNENKSVLGPTFKEFHAVKLNDQNWKTLSNIYEKILERLFYKVKNRNLGLLVVVISEERFKANAGWLTKIVADAIQNRDSDFGRLFYSFGESDLPVVYYRVNQLFPILRYREFFGVPGDEFEFYPDSTGKVLNYSNTNFHLSGTMPFLMPFNYFDIIRMVGDAYIKSMSSVSKDLNFQGWPTSEQHLTKFQPTDSANSFIIQTCDIVSNFIFSFIRNTAGLTDKKYELKSSAIEKNIDLSKVAPYIKASFIIDGKDVICSDQSLWANISPIIS